MHAFRDHTDARPYPNPNRAPGGDGTAGGRDTGPLRRRSPPLVPRTRSSLALRCHHARRFRRRSRGNGAERSAALDGRRISARTDRLRQCVRRESRLSRPRSGSLFHRRRGAPCDNGLRRRNERDRDLRARIRRLDARLRRRRVDRSSDGQHRGHRRRAADPDDDHVEPAGVDHDTGAVRSRRRDARLDEGSRRQRRRAIAPSAHVDRLRACCGPGPANRAELGRSR